MSTDTRQQGGYDLGMQQCNADPYEQHSTAQHTAQQTVDNGAALRYTYQVLTWAAEDVWCEPHAGQ